jgi:uncharacterized membrane protein YhiD involved in acid resistance
MPTPQKSRCSAVPLLWRGAGQFIIAVMISIWLVQPAQSRPIVLSGVPVTAPIATVDVRFTPTEQRDDEDSVLSRLFGARPESVVAQDKWHWRVLVIALRFMLAALLAGALAFRPHKDLLVLQRNPFVGQTQILVAVVGAAMMMVVADSVARAFGIFAAASLVRFRTNIRDPKEITVLLICLAIGLATGVGRLEISITLTLFVLLTLWILERFEHEQVARAMEVKVKTLNIEQTDAIMKKIFKKHKISAELRKLDRENDEDPMGTILYFISVSPAISTDQLSTEIFSTDAEAVDSIEWEQKRSSSYIYR